MNYSVWISLTKGIVLMKKLLYVLIGCVFWTNSQAAGLWTSYSEISRFQVSGYGITFWTGYSNPALSTCASGTRWEIRKTASNYDHLASALMAAYLSNNIINMYIPSTTPSCAPDVTAITVKKP
jgi:hypothetical protein